MLIEQTAEIAAPRSQVWAVLTNMSLVAQCMPGVQAFAEERGGVYTGVFGVAIGPIKVRLEGRVTVVEMDETTWTTRMKAEAADKRMSGHVTAVVRMEVHEIEDAHTRLIVVTDAAVLGRLGEFGQAVMKRKADQILGEFVRNASALIKDGGGAGV